MRRIAVALAVVCVAATLFGGDARAELPSLAGRNVVIGRGPSAILVRLDRPATIDFDNTSTWLKSFATRGAYAAVLIQQITHPGDRQMGQNLFTMRLSRPAGCRTTHECTPVTHDFQSIHGSYEDGVPETMTLEPGTYWVYVLTDPGRRIEVNFRLPGLDGETRLRTSVPVKATMSQRMASTPLVNHEWGRVRGRLSSFGLVAYGSWQSASDHRAYAPITCFQKGRGDDLCGFPTHIPRLGSARANVLSRRARYTYSYKDVGIETNSRTGAYMLCLTFL